MSKVDEIREAAEADLEVFINLVHPLRMLGSVHKELIRWWTRENRKSHQLVLLPRDHQKSAMVAYRVAWWITKHPDVRILYISSTANLATKQLKFIKDILTSPTYTKYWPDMVHPDEGKREKWTETEISVDHPLRAKEAVRDPTVLTAGLTTGIVGFHCDVAVLDDVVVGSNAFTADGRSKVKQQYSFLSSIESADADEWAVGTRYFPTDLYNDMQEMVIESYDDLGNMVGSEPLYEVFERAVEDAGDGTGQFLWPVQRRHDGKPFGFDKRILAKKKAQYLDQAQFRAQYYNNPNDPDNAPIDSSSFQYYDRSYLSRSDGYWHYKANRLNVFAAIDFAYSTNQKADYTAIVVVGVDAEHNYYILDIDRFRTGSVTVYFEKILNLHQKWGFRKIRAEVTAAQEVIVKALKESHIRPYGLALTIDKHRPTRSDGSKAERIASTLEPRYNNGQIWHYHGGHCQTLEEELTLSKPPHDDVKDSLAMCIGICTAPSKMASTIRRAKQRTSEYFHERFGGVA